MAQDSSGGKMPTIQEKFEGTVSKLQSGIEDGKSKLQTAQEISKHKKVLKEVSEEKAILLFRLGELVYKKIRIGEIEKEGLDYLINDIISKDKELFDNQKMIEDLSNSQNSESLCTQCGSNVLKGDKFCGSCGTKVEIKQELSNFTLVECNACSTEITDDSRYCPSCGTKQQLHFEGGLD